MSTYAIGDVQGCYDELIDLLNHINYSKVQDSLWFAGDIVNRGPKNLETVQLLMSLDNCKIVLGNHDLHFLALATGVMKSSKSDTIDDLLDAENLDEIVNWMRHLPLIYRCNNSKYVMAHAGIPNIWSIQLAIEHASEVEKLLQSNAYTDFLDAMYGNLPNLWSDDLTGINRYRLITNYLTRMRYCTINGELELTHKTNISPTGYSPWFTHARGNTDENYSILFGHWAALDGVTNNSKIVALDTGCVWGGRLTAYRLDDQQIFSVPARSVA